MKTADEVILTPMYEGEVYKYHECSKGEAKKIFEAIMVIADGRDKAYKELEEKDKTINAMAEYISKKEILVDKHCYALTAEAIKQYFKKQVT